MKLQDTFGYGAKNKIFILLSSYINTKRHIYADRDSRSVSIYVDHEFLDSVFDEICCIFRTPTIEYLRHN